MGKVWEKEGNTRDPETKFTASVSPPENGCLEDDRLPLKTSSAYFQGQFLAVSFTEGKYEGGLRDSERCFMKWNFNACNIVAMRFRYSEKTGPFPK